MRRYILARLRRNNDGSTAVEFAIVSFAFFIMMFGIIEYGLIMMSKVAVESAVMQVSRSTSIGTSTFAGCTDRVCAVKKLVEDKSFGLINRNSVKVTATVVTSASTLPPAVPDVCLDSISDPYPSSCTSSWVNNDGVAGYQQTGDIDAASLGTENQLVEIRISYLWRVIFPIFSSYFGDNGVLSISSSTVIKNEPFGS